jgi:5-hydroxyisourate hydrolase-like protein (transthyretin family)
VSESVEQGQGRTDCNGCLAVDAITVPARGIYRLVLDTDGYFVTLGLTPVFPAVTVEFRVPSAEHEMGIVVVVMRYTYFVYQES